MLTLSEEQEREDLEAKLAEAIAGRTRAFEILGRMRVLEQAEALESVIKERDLLDAENKRLSIELARLRKGKR